ncbi:Cna B-type domain-containing protein, partial [Enterococcus sp. ALS3]
INGTTITNSYTPGKTSVTVTKAWDDSNNQDGLRPEGIKVQLYANGEKLKSPVLLNDSNNWTTTWDDLPERESEKAIEYTVKEVDKLDGYDVSIDDHDKGNIIITNSHNAVKKDGSNSKTKQQSFPATGENQNKLYLIVGLILIAFLGYIILKKLYNKNTKS